MTGNTQPNDKKSARPASTPPPTPVPVKPAPTTAAPALNVPHLFRRRDWLVALATFLIAFGFFFYYMSPSVTLQDSGELVTGAYHFGVPHPPGYPLWAFLGWIWRHVVPFGNPAWRICLMSVFTGALVVGVMTLFMSRSIQMLIRATPWAESLDEHLQHWMALLIGASASLLFGFNRGVWLWACVPEMRVLSVFFFTAMTCTFFIWMMRPEKYTFLYATVLIYALGITNHQTIAVMGLPLLVGALATGLSARTSEGKLDLSAFFELLVMFLIGWAVALLMNAWLQTGASGHMADQKIKMLILGGPEMAALPLIFLVAAAGIGLAIWGSVEGWINPRRAGICTGLFLLGISFYAYMPIASATNPPMNWGFASTKQGFLHAFMRGQYERLNVESPLSDKFRTQVGLFLKALGSQYSWPLVLVGLVPLAVLIIGWKQLHPRARSWLVYLWTAFVIASIGLLTIINPGVDKQQQEITIKFFAPAHGFYGMFIGYGLALFLAAALARWPEFPRVGARALCVAFLALPVISFTQNYRTCEQRGHDFGYQFGYRMFNPGGDYPAMERDAVLYGGTDPGRFVPTYMIFCESRSPQKFLRSKFDPAGSAVFDRRDVYIITQNALADATYMSYIRDHYDYSRPDWNNGATLTNRPAWQNRLFGWAWHALDRATMYPRDPIWIPSEQDIQKAFQEYVADYQARRARGEPVSQDEEIEFVNGRVSVRGVGGVMRINGILTKWIFDRNKDKHAFYVEESYVISWMYPYLSPAGIIMKINRDPLPPHEQAPALWQQIVARDRAYWDNLEKEFNARAEFKRDTDAQKTFSKLRSAIGGLYGARRMYPEAEYAYQQARRLCPESPEANFRLAQLYMERGLTAPAEQVLLELQKLDPLNEKIGLAIEQIRQIAQARAFVPQLEQARQTDPTNVRVVVQLAQTYARAGSPERIGGLTESYLAQTNITNGDMLQVAQLFLAMGNADRALATFRSILGRFPQDSQAWYWVAVIRSNQGAPDEALMALERAFAITPALRDQARKDPRFGPLQNNPRFQQLLGNQSLRLLP